MIIVVIEIISFIDYLFLFIHKLKKQTYSLSEHFINKKKLKK